MKKTMALILAVLYMLVLAGCGSKLVEGSEKTYSGTVCDMGMSVVNEGDRQGRPYVILTSEEGDVCFWLREDCENPANIGDHVIVESAIEARTNLLVATKITVA